MKTLLVLVSCSVPALTQPPAVQSAATQFTTAPPAAVASTTPSPATATAAATAATAALPTPVAISRICQATWHGSASRIGYVIRPVERLSLHHSFRRFRARGEWFRLIGQLRKIVETVKGRREFHVVEAEAHG